MFFQIIKKRPDSKLSLWFQAYCSSYSVILGNIASLSGTWYMLIELLIYSIKL